jgi:hypothetical protein
LPVSTTKEAHKVHDMIASSTNYYQAPKVHLKGSSMRQATKTPKSLMATDMSALRAHGPVK